MVHRGTSPPADTSKLWFDTATALMKAYVAGAWKVLEGEWYLKSGVLIDATKGIRLYGKDMAFGTFANETDARAGTNWQTKMGSDGKIYAGAGDIILDTSGITIKGQALYLNYGATNKGWLYGSAYGLALICASGYLNVGLGSVYMTIDTNGVDFTGVTRVNMSACQYLDIPRSSSVPTGYGGRHYYNTSTDRCYNYYAGAYHTY